MNRLIISIGSNYNSEDNISTCKKILENTFDSIYFSSTSITIPYGNNYKDNFLNQLALATTEKDLDETKLGLKLIEKEMGRSAEDKKNGIVKVDIDLVKWNEIILKPEDWQRSYVVDLLPSLFQAMEEL